MSMLISALTAHSARLNRRIGLTSESRLMPLARTAVSSWSALNRAKINSVAVNIPIGNAKTHTNGISNPIAWATIAKLAWRLIKIVRISLSTLPSKSTKVNTATVSSSDARIWRSKYACKVLKTKSISYTKQVLLAAQKNLAARQGRGGEAGIAQ